MARGAQEEKLRRAELDDGELIDRLADQLAQLDDLELVDRLRLFFVDGGRA